jgi:hypothetical protein
VDVTRRNTNETTQYACENTYIALRIRQREVWSKRDKETS